MADVFDGGLGSGLGGGLGLLVGACVVELVAPPGCDGACGPLPMPVDGVEVDGVVPAELAPVDGVVAPGVVASAPPSLSRLPYGAPSLTVPELTSISMNGLVSNESANAWTLPNSLV